MQPVVYRVTQLQSSPFNLLIHFLIQLANLEVGGTKGKVLTTSVAQIHLDFGLAVDAVKNVDYDVMDLDAAGAFENSYQTFRSGMPLPLLLMSLLLF